MTNYTFFTNLLNGLFAIDVVAVLGFSGFAYAADMTAVPTCSIYYVPSVLNNSQSATLVWNSTDGAVFASLDNGIGAIAPDGQLIVAPSASTVYTMHTWNTQGEGNYCSVGLSVDANGFITGGGQVEPNVTVQTLGVYPASSQVSLGNVPYTGVKENVLYTMFLLTLLLTAGYVAQRKVVLS